MRNLPSRGGRDENWPGDDLGPGEWIPVKTDLGKRIGETTNMQDLMENDILTKVARYNLIRNQRMIYIDVHEALAGNLAGKFVAVPNLINIIARQEFQGVGTTESEALDNCLSKIKNYDVEDLFPTSNPTTPAKTSPVSSNGDVHWAIRPEDAMIEDLRHAFGGSGLGIVPVELKTHWELFVISYGLIVSAE